MKVSYADLGLKDMPFRIVPEKLSLHWVGRKELLDQVERKIESAIIASPSLFWFIAGRYGAGKTHLAYHMTNEINHKKFFGDKRGHSYYMKFPKPLKKASAFFQLYISFVNKLDMRFLVDTCEAICVYYEGKGKLENSIRTELTNENEDLAKIIISLGNRKHIEECKKWLLGDNCGETIELHSSIDNGGGMVSEVWAMLLRILTFPYIENKFRYDEIFLWIDEIENMSSLYSVKDQIVFLSNARDLIDACPNNLTLVFIGSFASIEEIEPNLNEALVNRLSWKLWIDPLESAEEASDFLSGLIKGFRNEKKVTNEEYPFTRKALITTCEMVKTAKEALLPRDLMNAAAFVLENAVARDYLDGKKVIDEEYVKNILPEYLVGK